MPVISIIMPVFNAERFIEASINSILNQTLKDFEFIIIDDGSTDNSVATIKNYNDARIKLFEKGKNGISSQLNFAISVAKSEYIARMDADDISHSDRFEKQYNFLMSNKEIDIVGSNCLVIDYNNSIIGKKVFPEKHLDIYNMMPIEQCISHPSILMKKSMFNKIMYQRDFEPAEDHKLFLQFLEQGFKFYNIQEYLLSYRSLNHFKKCVKSTTQKKISYTLGKQFVNLNYEKERSVKGKTNHFYKIAMLEYYDGNMKSARQNFIKHLKYSNDKIFITFRYILPSFLGKKIYNLLRNNFSLKLNYLLKKVNIETHNI